jgi:hypothetical protein
MGRTRAALALAAGIAAAAILVSGGSSADPRTPPALPGQPAPFLGTAVAGSGHLTVAVDAYGDVVDLRPRGPAGAAWTAVSSARQAAGSVPSRTGIVARAGAGAGPPLSLWRARWVRQRYVRGSNVVRTSAAVGGARIQILDAVPPPGTALFRLVTVAAEPGRMAKLGVSLDPDPGVDAGAACSTRPGPRRRSAGGLRWRARDHLRVRIVCAFERPQPDSAAPVERAVSADRRWLGRARPLGEGAPDWARRMYARSLLAIHALTDAESGAAAAGARDDWAYVWPRDAGAVAIALARAGYRHEARGVARFLRRLDLDAAARFRGDGTPVEDGRPLPGDAEGWIRAAADAAGLSFRPAGRTHWRDRGDYGERSSERGDYIANAIAAGIPARRLRAQFGDRGRLVRRAYDPSSGVDAAVAWAVRPFPRPALFDLVRPSLRSLLAGAGRFGIVPTEQWPGEDPWTAPTAWVAWSLAVLGDRPRALDLIGDLRRAATPAGVLPERVAAGSGIARSTTPLAWSHAFTALALQQLWPPR